LSPQVKNTIISGTRFAYRFKPPSCGKFPPLREGPDRIGDLKKSVLKGIRMANTAQHLDTQQHPPDAATIAPERPLDPGTIRETVSALIAQGQLALACEMTDLATVIHPNNESVLAMGALVAEVAQDWYKAHALLTRLRHLQGESITSETYRHEIRVLRCLGSDMQAMNLVKVALKRFPNDDILQQEHEELLSLFKFEFGTIG
jgi:hypothetical protein